MDEPTKSLARYFALTPIDSKLPPTSARASPVILPSETAPVESCTVSASFGERRTARNSLPQPSMAAKRRISKTSLAWMATTFSGASCWTQQHIPNQGSGNGGVVSLAGPGPASCLKADGRKPRGKRPARLKSTTRRRRPLMAGFRYRGLISATALRLFLDATRHQHSLGAGR